MYSLLSLEFLYRGSWQHSLDRRPTCHFSLPQIYKPSQASTSLLSPKKSLRNIEVAMVPFSSKNKEVNRGSWTAEEDQKLSQVIEIHGPRKWKSVATKAGLNRCGKSCRLRWMNYLRPNIKRGNISDQEEDLILRLHKLLGNRWSLIAGRLPGRTDNEIKNYWNSYLSKKMKHNERSQNRNRVLVSTSSSSAAQELSEPQNAKLMEGNAVTIGREDNNSKRDESYFKSMSFNGSSGDEFLFGCSNADEGPLNLEWMNRFLELDESWFTLHDI